MFTMLFETSPRREISWKFVWDEYSASNRSHARCIRVALDNARGICSLEEQEEEEAGDKAHDAK